MEPLQTCRKNKYGVITCTINGGEYCVCQFEQNEPRIVEDEYEDNEEEEDKETSSRSINLLNPSHLSYSCHHGDSNQPNTLLSAIKVLESYQEIGIVEIDFVYMNKQFLSSHDYDENAFLTCSPLHEWILEVIIKRKRILWIDIKENWSIVFQCLQCRGKSLSHETNINNRTGDIFNPVHFFNELEQLRSYYYQLGETNYKSKIDIANYILIGCQDERLNHTLNQIVNGKFVNNVRKSKKPQLLQVKRNHWRIILDKPRTTYYIKDYLPSFLHSLINQYTRDDLMWCDFSKHEWIGLDASVFDFNVDCLTEFIKTQSSINHNSHIIIYTLPETMDPIKIDGYHIISQYDYSIPSCCLEYDKERMRGLECNDDMKSFVINT